MTPDEVTGHEGSIPALPNNYTRADMHHDLRTVFETDSGRRVLGHLMAWADFYAPTEIMKGMTGAESALVHEGKRIVGLHVIHGMRRVNPQLADQKVTYGGRIAK